MLREPKHLGSSRQMRVVNDQILPLRVRMASCDRRGSWRAARSIKEDHDASDLGLIAINKSSDAEQFVSF